MKTRTGWFVGITLLAGLAAPSELLGQAGKIRWDIVSIRFGTGGAPNIVSPGGISSSWAYAVGGIPRVRITMTGSGTFSPFDPTDVTGGGSWTIVRYNAAAMRIDPEANGTFTVTELVSYVPLPDTAPFSLQGVPGQSRAGLAVLRIAYSDGSRGILVISCNRPCTSADTFEGIVATKDGVSFVNHESPVPNVDADRTVFIAVPAT